MYLCFMETYYFDVIMSGAQKTPAGKCDACDKTIDGACIVFICKSHSVCFSCVQTMPGLIPNWTTKEGMCPYCRLAGAARLEETTFKQPFAKNIPQSLTLMHMIDLTFMPWCGWSSLYDDIIAIGRRFSSAVEMINLNKQVTSHILPIGKGVLSGLYLDSTKLLICVKNPDTVFTCDIDPKSVIPTTPVVRTTLDVPSPICVFAMPRFQYGILCMDPSRIEIFSKRCIYTEDQTQASQVVRLNLPRPDEYDCACSTPDGHICVTSYIKNKVYIYNNTGILITLVGVNTKLKTPITANPGVRFPVSVEATEDGTVLITGERGEVQTYKESTGLQSVKSRDAQSGTRAGVLTDTKFWNVKHGPIKYSIDVYTIM